jgi:transposase
VRGRKPGFVVVLSAEERSELERWQRLTTRPAGEVRRARAILLLAEQRTLKETAQYAGMTVVIVRKWAHRFLEERVAGLGDKPGRGRKPVFSP